MEINMILTQAAKGVGGDKYEANIPDEPRAFVIYVPQRISRVGGKPARAIKVTIEVIA